VVVPTWNALTTLHPLINYIAVFYPDICQGAHQVHVCPVVNTTTGHAIGRLTGINWPVVCPVVPSSHCFLDRPRVAVAGGGKQAKLVKKDTGANSWPVIATYVLVFARLRRRKLTGETVQVCFYCIWNVQYAALNLSDRFSSSRTGHRPNLIKRSIPHRTIH